MAEMLDLAKKIVKLVVSNHLERRRIRQSQAELDRRYERIISYYSQPLGDDDE